MSTPSEKHAGGPGKAPREVRHAILADARPMPDLPDEERIQLSDKEARVFFEVIENA